MQMPSRRLVAACVAALVILAGGIRVWRDFVIEKQALSAESTIAQSIREGDFLRARSALSGLPDPVKRAESELAIRTAEVQQALRVRDTALLRIATAGPEGSRLDPALREAADLKLAREAIWVRDFDQCGQFVDRWQESPALPGKWVLLKADLLLAQGDRAAARQLLEQAELSGADDGLRHARLALLQANQPWKAMESIDAGLGTDPRNADLLCFRAQIEEAAGRINDARLDYVAAVLSEPENPLYRDILANFQLRIGEPSNAAETWLDAAEVTGLGIYAFKAWFWSRVGGVPLGRQPPEIRQPGWDELIAALSGMNQGVLWKTELEIPLARIRGGSARPEIAWLRLLETIRSKDWPKGVEGLEAGFPREAEQLAPGLPTRLLANLTALAGGNPRVSITGRDLPPPGESAHPFLIEFDAWRTRSAPDEPFIEWLRDPASPAATLFAHGWHGAALDVAGGADLAPVSRVPEWFDFGYSRCLLVRDGADAAARWLESLPERSTAADLAYGEILLTNGSVDEGLGLLEDIAAGGSPHAGRAAWTLALLELERGRTARARERVKGCAELAADPRGREILARAALAEGKRAEADAIYQELGAESVDAMIFLSKEAFANRNWQEARKWTTALARRFPSEPQFRKNLIKIREAEEEEAR